MPRKAIGDAPMTPAERQARRRAQHRDHLKSLSKEQRFRRDLIALLDKALFMGLKPSEALHSAGAFAFALKLTDGHSLSDPGATRLFRDGGDHQLALLPLWLEEMHHSPKSEVGLDGFFDDEAVAPTP